MLFPATKFAGVDDLHSRGNFDGLKSEAGVPANRPPVVNVGLSGEGYHHLQALAYPPDFLSRPAMVIIRWDFA